MGEGSRLPHADAIWKSKSPLKVRVFVWLVVKDAILIWKNLQKREWQDPSYRVPWGSQGEGIHHLFLECIYSVRVWTKCASLFRLRLDMSGFDSV